MLDERMKDWRQLSIKFSLKAMVPVNLVVLGSAV